MCQCLGGSQDRHAGLRLNKRPERSLCGTLTCLLSITRVQHTRTLPAYLTACSWTRGIKKHQYPWREHVRARASMCYCVCVSCGLAEPQLSTPYEGGGHARRLPLHTTLTTVPTRRSPDASLWMGQIAIWMKTLNKLYNSWRHVPGGLSHINATWAVAIVLCLCGGTEQPIRMLFLSTHRKENCS